MSAPISNNLVPTSRTTRMLLIKWVVALLVPLLVFTFVWQGDSTINNVILGFLYPQTAPEDTVKMVESIIFMAIFYLGVLALAGYLMAADSGRRAMWEVWVDSLVFAVLPIFLISVTNNLVIGLALSGIIWPIFFLIRNRLKFFTKTSSPLANLRVLDKAQRALLLQRARLGGLWLGISLGVIWLVLDVVFYFSGSLPVELLIWGVVRTVILVVAGFFLGALGGRLALGRALTPENNLDKAASNAGEGPVTKEQELKVLSKTRAREEAADLVPNDLPLRSSGARRFYLTMLIAFVIFYPALDPLLFGYGSGGRIAGYGDAGYYVILALGLNIVVGFAGLLDLGYVAFFAIGAYTWGIIGSTQLGIVTNIHIDPQVVSWLFWPLLIVVALFAAFWGVVLGAPTLRLRGDYLAIVTLGFGEIVPVVVLNMDQYTNGTNGIVGVRSPAFFGVDWSTFTPIPYYYLILALIALTIFANIRLRDSRLGRAWIAIREDEIAAASSGVNLVRTKLFAFGAGAFFSGIAGAYHSAKLGGVSPDTFGFGDSVIYLAMVVIGGIGSIPGVIVGALTVYAVNLFILNQLDTLAADPTNPLFSVSQTITQHIPGFTFGNIRNLIFGIILVTIMIFRPEGLIPSARRRRELHSKETGEFEMGALEPPPSDPAFESEVRIQ